MAIITLILQPMGYYSDGDWRYLYSHVIVINLLPCLMEFPSFFTPVMSSGRLMWGRLGHVTQGPSKRCQKLLKTNQKLSVQVVTIQRASNIT